MIGVVVGDITGSVYEHRNVKTKNFGPLVGRRTFFTDDTVHTVAVAHAILDGAEIAQFEQRIQEYTLTYPRRGYGGKLRRWARSADPRPYDSFGNGSAMRVAGCGWWATSEQEAMDLGRVHTNELDGGVMDGWN